MRGEDCLLFCAAGVPGGSPPHARGRRRRRSPAYGRTRITPACAGKTCAKSNGVANRTDHPRMRGEDTYVLKVKPANEGSPPHARGRLSGPGRHPLNNPDHPRMRGEDVFTPGTTENIAGSPPHARGRRYLEADLRGKTGITPACAGKTALSFYYVVDGKDHPRMRGEDTTCPPS